MSALPTTDRERFDKWQNQALKAWEDHDRVGIVEAVTGAGKSHVAYKVLDKLLATKGKRVYPLIVVPTLPLLHQWKRGIEEHVPVWKVGLIGGGHHDDFSRHDIVVSTMHSAPDAIEASGLFAHVDKDPSARTLLVADECHHVTSATAKLFPKVLDFPFDYRLGLSATLDDWAIEGLGHIVFQYRLAEAVRDGVVPPFDVLKVGVNLTSSEVAEYLQLGNAISELLGQVCDLYGLNNNAGQRLWVKLHEIAEETDCSLVRKLFGRVFKRAELVYTAQQRQEIAPKLIAMLLQRRRKALAFFERIATAETVCDDVPQAMARSTSGSKHLAPYQSACFTYHSKMNKMEREQVFSAFRQAGSGVLMACRALNEGVDVPTVDAGVVVASTQSARAMIQRIGRVLRWVPGKARPVIVSLYAKGTNDELAQIDPNDEYYKGAARIFDVSPNECVSFLESLIKNGSPLA